MLTLRSISIALAASFLLTSGCIAEPTTDEAMGEDVAETQEALIDFANGVFAEYFQNGDVRDAVKLMGMKPLPFGSNFLSSTANGREVIAHLVNCALPIGNVVMINGVKYYGRVGLWPQWADVPLDNVKAQRWITACLLQSLNGYGVSIDIGLDGSNAMLHPGEPLPGYEINDITTFGNAFAANPTMYVCHSKDLEAACGYATSSKEKFRVCGNSASCGMIFLGACAGVCEYDEKGSPACTVPGGDTYKESIQSSLSKDGFQKLYQDCQL